jgi:hypothetical protein
MISDYECDKIISWDVDQPSGLKYNFITGNPDKLNKNNNCQYFKKKFFSKKQQQFFCKDCIHWRDQYDY